MTSARIVLAVAMLSTGLFTGPLDQVPSSSYCSWNTRFPPSPKST
jgi:hypothetical protein